jgi:hypothetical protein
LLDDQQPAAVRSDDIEPDAEGCAGSPERLNVDALLARVCREVIGRDLDVAGALDLDQVLRSSRIEELLVELVVMDPDILGDELAVGAGLGTAQDLHRVIVTAAVDNRVEQDRIANVGSEPDRLTGPAQHLEVFEGYVSKRSRAGTLDLKRVAVDTGLDLQTFDRDEAAVDADRTKDHRQLAVVAADQDGCGRCP